MWHPSIGLLPKKPISTATTCNILTFMQVICNKKVITILPVIYNVYESKKWIQELYDEAISNNERVKCLLKNGARVYIYKLHDAKMLYILTQHSYWNRVGCPYLLCDCTKGETVTNNNHCCNMNTYNVEIACWTRSKQM